jgi:hypothetical protein
MGNWNLLNVIFWCLAVAFIGSLLAPLWPIAVIVLLLYLFYKKAETDA